MASDFEHTSHVPMIRLLDAAFDEFTADLAKRVAATAYSDIRVTHGCVFGTIDPEGTRLTDLAERAHMTKQSVGEVASDLEQRGYVERVPDPSDGRAKIIRLTDRGREAQRVGFDAIGDLERRWAEQYGEERVRALKEVLIAVAGPAAAELRDAA